MDDFEIELKKDFLQEAKELLINTEQFFLELETDPSNRSLIDNIFRFAHNLKGTSRAVGFGQIAELTHKAENLLLEIKQEKLKANEKIVSILLEFNDRVREMIDTLSENIDAQFDNFELIEKISNVGNDNNMPSTKTEEQASVEVVSIQETANGLTPPSSSLFEEETITDIKVTGSVNTNSETVINTVVEKIEVKKNPKKEDETLRVSLQRLEKLNDMVGELVILQSLVESTLTKSGEVKTARALTKLCSNIQDLSMSLRLVPIGPTFQKLTRIVRDTSKLLGKKVDLKLIGEDVEIDKTVAESLGDPLVHIIRNAIDHGIEQPHDRLLDEKTEEGHVEVMAFHEGNFLVIQITDDGKGINSEKLIEKAKAKGIISEKTQLSNQQGIELIFHPGFSTKDQVSEVSGRGVGMDVVKTNIEALGGEVRVKSMVGQGSSFKLILPLTLAIIEGMLVKIGESVVVIPKNQVHEVIRLEKEKLSTHTGRLPYYSLRGQVLPVFGLEQDLGINTKSESEIALIVKTGNAKYAVQITDIIRQQQVVVKPLTREMLGRHGIMGTTILGDGKPAIIIDLLDMYQARVKKELSAA